MGEWDDEPSEFDFTDDATGLTCAMRRGPWKSWCGYVALPPGHPLFGKSYADAVTVPSGYLDRDAKVDEDYGAISLFVASLTAKPEENIWPLDLAVRCHGGLTYASDHCPMAEPDGNWWFGFDCSHSGDFSPGLNYSQPDDVYRNAEYVKASLAKLCGDIATISQPVAEAA